MFPIRDDNPTLGAPAITVVLIGLNVAAWILRFTGNFPMECPAPAANCPDLHSAVIVLDAQTGEFISGTYTE